MGPASVVTGILAFVFAAGSMFLVAVPMAGVACSIVSLVLSLVAIVLGGVGMSQAGDRGESNALPVTGLVIGVMAFITSFLLTMTCGACNACVTFVDSHIDGGLDFTLPPLDGGASTSKPPYDDDASTKPPFRDDDAGVAADDASASARPPAPPDGAIVPPPPAFPPPPMNHLAPARSR